MRILLLTRSFNSLAQRLWLDLAERGHELSVEFDINDSVTEEAITLFKPALVIAPYLTRAIPESVWRRHVCLVVHPGVAGDRGPSALDWALSEGEARWGVTVLQATAEMDAGPVWATETFALRSAAKSSVYRQEVTDAAVRAVARAVLHFETHGTTPPPPTEPDPRGRWRGGMRQTDRRIDWDRDDTATVLRRLHAGDGAPGVADALFGNPCLLFDAHAEARPAEVVPGQIYGRRDGAVLRATVDGAVSIGHVRRLDIEGAFKLPVALAFATEVAALPARELPLMAPLAAGWQEIRYEAAGGVGTLHFPFYNGAMSTAQCQRLTSALRFALARPEQVLVLAGGPDFWSNGIHLQVIENAASPADESWRNINAIDDLALTLIEARDRFVVAALQGNAGAGGVFLALAADAVWAREGMVLNPHYKNMGNLYGSEYWTYLLPRRLARARNAASLQAGVTGHKAASAVPPGAFVPDDGARLMHARMPVSARQARGLGLVDEVLQGGPTAFLAEVQARAAEFADRADLPEQLRLKALRRAQDEAQRPLADYRDAELQRMHRNFYGFDPSFHIARSNFVRRVAHAWTPRHLARHR